MRFFLEISYDGADFYGWQVQPNKRTVQGEFNVVLSKILQEPIHVIGCGRTDSGVHASQFYLHFDCKKQPYENLVHKLNTMLPETICVKRSILVSDEQHSRFDATYREYIYHAHFQKNPFRRHHSFQCIYKDLDLEVMQRVAASLTEYKDFQALSKWNEDINSSICEVSKAELTFIQQENRMELKIGANRFLHNMIRRIMGLLISVGRGKISEQEVKEVMRNNGSFKLNFVAPPEGLFLCAVKYPYRT